MVFDYRPSHFFEKNYTLLDHTQVTKVSYKATDWVSIFVIISRADVLFIVIWTYLQVRVGDLQEFIQEIW